jgi:hypothetical protein
MKAGSTKVVRCAIYSRVSTDQGLEQDFNSLDAQYDASQAYIRSQAHAGWTLLRPKYDDGGFSGGHTDRPSPTAPGVTHRWTNLTAFTEEIANARIWAGFHYRFSTRVGTQMGLQIGEYVAKNAMQPM